MQAIATFALHHRRTVLAFWIVAFAVAALFAQRLEGVLKGSSDTIDDSPSGRVTQALHRAFGAGSAYPFAFVLSSATVGSAEPRFAEAAGTLERALLEQGAARDVRSFWNSGLPELLGQDGHSALLWVTPAAPDFAAAERSTADLRRIATQSLAGTGFQVQVTGTVALFHDLNRSSSADLLEAERIGIPITLLILLAVFGAPLAACLPLVLAIVSMVIGMAGLFALSHWMPVSVFAQNAVSMIGLGVGVDYALFVISRFRTALREGADPSAAALRATTSIGRAVAFSGLTVAIGFLSLFLVRARFFQSLALGGTLVVAVALAATLTLLPVLLSYAGRGVNWPRDRQRAAPEEGRLGRLWGRWAHAIMRRPLAFAVAGLLLLALLIAPVLRLAVWNVGARDLDAQSEARLGYERLEHDFAGGWMGPVVLLLEGDEGALWQPRAQAAVRALTQRLEADPRIAAVLGFPRLLSALGAGQPGVPAPAGLPEAMRPLARGIASADGRVATLVLIPHGPPEHDDVRRLVAELRRDGWPELQGSGLHAGIGGATAMVADFDREMLDSLWRVIPAVLALTFVSLALLFRSLLIPLKATLLNLLSVLAAYGFLVWVFQDGLGADLLGFAVPGGLNSFVVLMLFTILSGLSMDYEVFMLTHIAEEHRRGASTADAVAAGLQRTGGLVTSAALIMVCLFGSFAFTHLTATREFGLGLAFAVLLDATLIRALLVPAFMALFGRANWWAPAFLRRRALAPAAQRI